VGYLVLLFFDASTFDPRFTRAMTQHNPIDRGPHVRRFYCIPPNCGRSGRVHPPDTPAGPSVPGMSRAVSSVRKTPMAFRLQHVNFGRKSPAPCARSVNTLV
jgi:hypothetical protein